MSILLYYDYIIFTNQSSSLEVFDVTQKAMPVIGKVLMVLRKFVKVELIVAYRSVQLEFKIS